MTTINPKEITGEIKVPVSLVSPVFIARTAAGLQVGALKYGKRNYLGIENLSISTYLEAIQRHLLEYMAGNDYDRDGFSNINAILANLCIIVEALEAGNIVDDRVVVENYHDFLNDIDSQLAYIKSKIESK